MTNGIVDQDFAASLSQLASFDPDIALAIGLVGAPEPQKREPGFATLVHIIVSQQVSLTSAAAIWQRLTAKGPITPELLLDLGGDGMREVGFSGPKTRYALELARCVRSGKFDPDSLPSMGDEPAIKHITNLLGFGRWSGEIYLMFSLGRPDIWPAADVALQEAIRHIKGLDFRPEPKEMYAIARPWRPWRSVAAHLFWRYYRHVVKGASGANSVGFQ